MKKAVYLIIILLMGTFVALHSVGLSNGFPREEYKNLIFSSETEMEELIPHILSVRARDDQRIRSMEYRGTMHWDRNADWEQYFDEIEQEFPLQLRDKKILTSISQLKWMGMRLVSSIQPDEQYVLNSVSKLSLNPLQLKVRTFLYGHFHTYAVGASLMLAEAIGYVTLTTDRKYYMKNPGMVSRIFAAGKLMGIIFGALAIPVVFLLGKTLFDWQTGLVAAALFTFIPQMVFEARVLKPGVFGQLWLCLSVFFAARLLYRPQMRFYILSGIMAGLAMGSSFFFAHAILALLMVHLLLWKNRQVSLVQLSGPAVSALLCTIFFLATNPSVIWLFEEFRASIFKANEYAGGSYLSFFLNPAYHWRVFIGFSQSLGIGLTLVTIGGLILSLYRKSREDLLLVGLFLICYVIYFKAMSHVTPHHQVGFFVVAVLLASHAITWFLREVRILVLLKSVAVALVFLNLVGQTLFYSSVLAFDNSSIVAGRWINDNIPKGSTIGNFVGIGGGHFPGDLPHRTLDYALVNDNDPGLSKIKKLQPNYYVAFVVADPVAPSVDPFFGDQELLQRYDLVKRCRYDVPLLNWFYRNDMVFYWIKRIDIFQKKENVQ